MPGTLVATNRIPPTVRRMQIEGISAMRSVSPRVVGGVHEPLEQLRAVADLKLQEPGTASAFFAARRTRYSYRRGAGVLDGAEEEVRRRARSRARTGTARASSTACDLQQLRAVEVEHPPASGSLPALTSSPVMQRDVLIAVHRRAHQLGLEAETVAVPAAELHDRLGAGLEQADRDRQRRDVCACADGLSVALYASTNGLIGSRCRSTRPDRRRRSPASRR